VSRALILAESLAEHAAYWDALGELTAAQKRWRAHELEWRQNMAAKGDKPTAWLVVDIRSGRKEQRDQRSQLNALRSQARLAQLQRQGYSFDEEHRLVAPPITAATITYSRGASRQQRPQSRRVACGSSRDGPRRPEDSDRPLARPRDDLAWRLEVNRLSGDELVAVARWMNQVDRAVAARRRAAR
jgi:hypothetical protein